MRIIRDIAAALGRIVFVLTVVSLLPGCQSGPPDNAAEENVHEAARAETSRASPRMLAIEGGTLIDGNGGDPVPDSVVLVEGDRISCAGTRATCNIPADAAVLSAKRQWVTPGLIDGHVHFSQTGWVDGRSDVVNVRASYPYHEVEASNRLNPERYFRAYLCSGVTSVFDVGGFTWSWSLRDRAEYDPMAPRISATGPLVALFGVPLTELPAEKQFLTMDSIESVRMYVEYLAVNSADAIKLYFSPVPEGRKEEAQAYVSTLAEHAGARDIPFVTHAPSLANAKFAVRAGTSLLVHSVSDAAVDDEFLSLARSSGSMYSPTLIVGDGYLELARSIRDGSVPVLSDPNQCVDNETKRKALSTPQLRELIDGEHAILRRLDDPAAIELRRDLMASNLMRIHDAGIPIVTGTDAGNPLTLPGPSINAEMEAMQNAGLTPMDVLVATTKNGALAMGRADDLGTLEAGKLADLLIVRKNPALDIANMRGVAVIIRGGHIHDQPSLRSGT